MLLLHRLMKTRQIVGPCQPERMPPMDTARPSAERRIVQNSDFGLVDGDRHWRTVWSDLGDVVIASNVYTNR
jgi:hypothetical protein